MDAEQIEQLAKELHTLHPSKFVLDPETAISTEWDNLVSQFPYDAEEYRREVRQALMSGSIDKLMGRSV